MVLPSNDEIILTDDTPNAAVQVDAAASYTGTSIASLVSTAAIPCGSTILLTGQSSGPVTVTCLPIPTSQKAQVGRRRGG